MALTTAQLQALKTELLTDPVGYGYAADGPTTPTPNVQGLADKLNLVRDGANGGPAITVRKDAIASKDIYEAIDIGDYTALPGNPNASQLSTERRFLAWLTGLAAIPTVRLLNDDGSNTPVITNLQTAFPAGSGTRTRLVALASRNGSRAEQLFGRNAVVTYHEVASALALP